MHEDKTSERPVTYALLDDSSYILSTKLQYKNEFPS